MISILMAAALLGGGPAVPKAPPVVTIHAKEFSYVAPTSISSGPTTFRLVNDGKQLHHMSITKLAKGKTMADLVAALKTQGPPPAWMTDVGGPNPALPGTTVEATLTLEPGDYVMMCFIPSVGETTPHAMQGMMKAFTVTPGKSDASEPAADATIHLTDYKFTISTPLAAGHHVIKVVNDASQSHELVLAELGPGKTMADVGTWVEKSLMKGPPPGKPIGGMAALSKGRSGSFPIDLKPGKYGLICFIPDMKDGKSHFSHGMVQEITVK